MRLGNRGQMSSDTMVNAFEIIGTIIGLSVLVIVLASFFPASETATTITGTVSYTTTNSSFTTDATDWDNGVSNQATDNWNAGGYITVESIDNSVANIDNGVYRQALSVSDLCDGVSSASLAFKYRVIDNDNAQSIEIRVKMWDGTDNRTIFYDNVTLSESTSWTTVDNDVSAYITATGTYTIYIGAEMNGKGNETDAAFITGNKPNIFVGFDDASLSVNVDNITSKAALGVLTGIEGLSWTSIALIAIGVIVLAAVVIVMFVRRMGGAV